MMKAKGLFVPILNRFQDFWIQPISPLPLGIYRISLAAFALLQAALWRPDWQAFFGTDAWIQWEISRALNSPWNIHMLQVHELLHAVFNTSESQSVSIFFGFYVLVLIGLLLGWFTRIWAVLSWLCHYIIMSTIPSFVYGVDIFLHISLFYLMVMPCNKALSLDLRFKRVNGDPSWGSTLAIRVLQVHLCLIYLSAGYEKMLAADWWNGNVLWRSLVQPDFRQFDFNWLARVPWLAVVLSWGTMFIETFYGIGMWIPRLRLFWLLGIIALHIGIALFLGLYLFGLIMILMSVSAFGVAAIGDFQPHKNQGQGFSYNSRSIP
jgi:Vitamin K-dependent gamma-carboxylase